ncbi:carbon monoxide dehydrogenase [Streptomyces sp. CB00455]|uniref:SRPBCC domain-containing protein n=1 Tax=Streptomyces sp. CB00455 TaxID=1703927 RepID=UPI00093F05C9|nr:SRPBCC domain-containing protein [Streptomyces sp. CB00455]OKK18386.1 carbon monoxide dehydrogenase [Streptomyces sp. CB00455]
MEHQVFVPVPPERLRAVLRDPVRVAGCLPGLQQDADTESGPLSGRLKVRVGGHTVTYRGALAVTEQGPDLFAVEGEGTEVRGSGSVKLAVAVRLTAQEDGTRLDVTAGGTADGRAAAFTAEATATAVRRLLERTAEQLAVAAAPGAAGTGVATATATATGTGTGTGTGDGTDVEPGPVDPAAGADAAEDAEDADDAEDDVRDPVAEAEAIEEAEGGTAGATDGDDVTEVSASVFETEVPPPTLDPFLADGFEDVGELPRPPAEAAHARRTMIGRSAEEVDHAPPRGRYAPVPAPTSAAAGDSLRWIAPAAALALASAVVLGRALRRRR